MLSPDTQFSTPIFWGGQHPLTQGYQKEGKSGDRFPSEQGSQQASDEREVHVFLSSSLSQLHFNYNKFLSRCDNRGTTSTATSSEADYRTYMSSAPFSPSLPLLSAAGIWLVKPTKKGCRNKSACITFEAGLRHFLKGLKKSKNSPKQTKNFLFFCYCRRRREAYAFVPFEEMRLVFIFPNLSRNKMQQQPFLPVLRNVVPKKCKTQGLKLLRRIYLFVTLYSAPLQWLLRFHQFCVILSFFRLEFVKTWNLRNLHTKVTRLIIF